MTRPPAVTVGELGEEVLVGIDTASPDFWVDGDCTDVSRLKDPASLCAKSHRYDSRNGSLLRPSEVKEYRVGALGFTGNATVEYHVDHVRVGGNDFSPTLVSLADPCA